MQLGASETVSPTCGTIDNDQSRMTNAKRISNSKCPSARDAIWPGALESVIRISTGPCPWVAGGLCETGLHRRAGQARLSSFQQRDRRAHQRAQSNRDQDLLGIRGKYQKKVSSLNQGGETRDAKRHH